MKVSIITATYNSAITIEGCINSVLSQSYPNIEYIIIDGASKDETPKTVASFAEENPNILYTSEPDKGIYDALNKGIKKASGDIIGFLHSDDFFENENVIQHIIETFEQKKCDGVYGDLKYVNAENQNKVIRFWKSQPFHQSLLKKGWMPAHPTLFLKKDVYQKHGNFDLNFKIAADYDFMLRILKDDTLKFTYFPQVITNMRIGGASNALGNIKLKMKEDLKAMRNNGIPLPFYTLLRKNASKILQFIKR